VARQRRRAARLAQQFGSASCSRAVVATFGDGRHFPLAWILLEPEAFRSPRVADSVLPNRLFSCVAAALPHSPPVSKVARDQERRLDECTNADRRAAVDERPLYRHRDRSVTIDAMTPDTKARRIGYWLTTALLGLVLVASGLADLIAPPELVELMTSLGYPTYLLTLLGVAKLLAAIAIFVPKFPRLKEWAYAGVAFNMIGASYSHIINGDPIGNILLPLGILALALASWWLRPSDRQLPSLRPV
jgi:uncharacterized membrane protein YphA (DoxX/SURF4 family)